MRFYLSIFLVFSLVIVYLIARDISKEHRIHKLEQSVSDNMKVMIMGDQDLMTTSIKEAARLRQITDTLERYLHIKLYQEDFSIPRQL